VGELGEEEVNRPLLAAAPVVLVNAVAFAGQLSYWNAVLVTVLAVVVAATLESIAVYVAYHAHLAQLANDSALRLRFAAYVIAAVIGALNYSHWCAPRWHLTPAAVAFALCSVLSPWLWGIHTRRTSRDRLMAAGLIEPHALRLGGTRWAWHPYRSVRVMSAATWEGVTDPGEAIAAVYAPAQDVAGERSLDGVSPGSPAAIPGTVPSSGFEAAKTRMRQAADLGFRYTDNQARADFHLTRAAVAEARRQVLPERGRGGATHPGAAAAPAAEDAPAGGRAPQPPAGAFNGQAAHG
jgi:hypothetical protein